MNLKEICEQLRACNFECEGGHIQSNVAFIELERLADVEEYAAVYDGPANPNAVNTVRTAIACYEGKNIRVSVVEVL
jgi:hypothetical protein